MEDGEGDKKGIGMGCCSNVIWDKEPELTDPSPTII